MIVRRSVYVAPCACGRRRLDLERRDARRGSYDLSMFRVWCPACGNHTDWHTTVPFAEGAWRLGKRLKAMGVLAKRRIV